VPAGRRLRPLTGGAFVAQFVAAEIGCGFAFAERIVAGEKVRYRIPGALRPVVRDRRVLLVDDAVNAGSALLATRQELLACGAQLAGCASLLALGDAAARIAAAIVAPFYCLATLERGMWRPMPARSAPRARRWSIGCRRHDGCASPDAHLSAEMGRASRRRDA
jgi:hypothetical protein